MISSTHRSGLVLVSAAAAAWSLGGLFTRLVDVDSWTLIAWRGVFVFAAVLVHLLVRESELRAASARPAASVGPETLSPQSAADAADHIH
ncbi:MAG TPA: hypothetical protein VK437_04850 [Steroidobacteraceae bacterium]|nr:hypothetical protein [Steroidobacteraceae bacterium]